MDKPDLWELERSLSGKGYRLICGADEAGAGPLAGPVYAGAVILPVGWIPEGLNDSKKLSAKTRDRLFDEIMENAVSWAVTSISEILIDKINILNARMLAMDQAIHALDHVPDFSMIDGDKNRGITVPNMTVTKGDSLSANIAAASILAKVSRDRYMARMDEAYPQYGFARHKGYGTKYHYEMLRTYGPCPIHRMSFLKNL